MAIRVRVEIRHGDVVITTSALVNSGYEVDEAELLIPGSLARRLGLEEVSTEEYRSVGASVSTSFLGYVDVRVVEPDRCSEWVRARAVSVPGEPEVLLSDKLIDALSIEPIRPGAGLWRFSGEQVLRRSVKPEFWI